MVMMNIITVMMNCFYGYDVHCYDDHEHSYGDDDQYFGDDELYYGDDKNLMVMVITVMLMMITVMLMMTMSIYKLFNGISLILTSSKRDNGGLCARNLFIPVEWKRLEEKIEEKRMQFGSSFKTIKCSCKLTF